MSNKQTAQWNKRKVNLAIGLMVLVGWASIYYFFEQRNIARAVDWNERSSAEGCVQVGTVVGMLNQLVLFRCSTGYYAMTPSFLERAAVIKAARAENAQ